MMIDAMILACFRILHPLVKTLSFLYPLFNFLLFAFCIYSAECGTDEDCEYGMKCDGQICKCPNVDGGSKCEKLSDSDCEKHLKGCHDSGGSCEFKKDKSIICKCRKKIWDPSSKECVEKCSTDSGCKFGKKCVERKCICPEGDRGSKCEKLTDSECKDKLKSCLDTGGSCEYEENKKVVCNCVEKVWDSVTAECVVNHCASNPCENEGTCVNKNDSYECNCKGRFGGKDCIHEVCFKNETKRCGDVACAYDRFLDAGYCVCDEGQEFDSTNKSCKAVDECLLKTINGECNKPHQTCKEGKCVCEDNYKYSKDGQSCEENFCKNRNTCAPNSDCVELGSGNVQCVCKQGYYPKGRVCKKIDLCSNGLSECEQLCDKKTGNCGCYSGFELKEDKKTCKPGKDESANCDLDCGVGKCVKKNSKEECLCPTITHHSNGTACIDICTHKDLTLPEGMCPTNKCELDEKHVFRCKCEDPYEQHEDGIHCKRKTMCADKKIVEICASKSAICKNTLTGKGYECICDNGFEKENGTCIRKCDMKVYKDKCASLRATCELNVTYDVVCRCPPMLKQGKAGSPCDTIARNSYTGKMSILKRKYEVKYGNGRFRRSTDQIDYLLLQDDMTKSMGETYGKDTEVKLLHCDVDQDLAACTLELQLQEDKTVSKREINIISSPTVCVPLDNGYCLLKPNLITKREEKEDVFRKTEACKEKVVKDKLCGKSTICTEGENGDFQCRCKKGFHVIGSYHPAESVENTFIQTCDDIDECANTSACPKSTDCNNKFGSYDCLCKDGFKKKNESSDPKRDGCDPLCDPNPCNHGICVVVGHHGFSCNCTEGYTGILCNTTSSVQGKNPEPDKKAAIVGGVLGGVLIIVLIIGFVVYTRRKNIRNDDEEYARSRQRGILTEMNRMRREQPRFEADRGLPSNERMSGSARRDSGEYRRELQDDRVIPRIQTSRAQNDEPESRRVYSDSEMAGRSYDRSSREEARSARGGNRMYYKNKGYDGD